MHDAIAIHTFWIKTTMHDGKCVNAKVAAAARRRARCLSVGIIIIIIIIIYSSISHQHIFQQYFANIQIWHTNNSHAMFEHDFVKPIVPIVTKS